MKNYIKAVCLTLAVASVPVSALCQITILQWSASLNQLFLMQM